MFNDLTLLTYRWGASPEDGSGCTDCFQLVCEVRRRLGLTDWAPRFAWVYDQFTYETLRPRQLIRWVMTHGQKVASPEPGDITPIGGLTTAALGVITPNQGLIYISPGYRVVHVNFSFTQPSKHVYRFV